MDGAELLLLLAQQSVSIHPPLSSHRSDNVASSLSRLDQRPSVHDNDDGDEIDQVHHTDTTPPAPLHPNSTTDKLQKKTRAVSCEKCHSAKRRCDRTRPSCAACLKRNVSCHYLADQSPDASAPRVSSLKMHPTQKAAKKQKLASDPSDATTTLPQTLSTLQVNSPTVSTPITPIYLSPSSHDTTAHLLTTASTGAQDPVDLLLMRLAKMRSTNPAAPPKKLALKMMALLDPETGTKVYHCIACRKRYITSSGLRVRPFSSSVAKLAR
ncbi:hypothetical protein BC830DRAFT_28559 [Chytriomyces sp. MP71]|nr:hypothetical protein BC830DRAFT_28559 [Chytriomyces sp. MP71]